ncbi:MAG: carbohydrate kinase [Lachnospiraceae bacterium]|nr:carbohydrate kinase [Lachnospiraceae bacterium]
MSSLITAIGEILIDLTQIGVNSSNIPLFAANPGGAPANVAVAASRLGARSAFIGCVGHDAYGKQLRQTLEADGVDVRGLYVTDSAPTTLAVVSVDQKGERSFQFYRHPGADIYLNFENISRNVLEETAILHFGSVSLTDEPSRSATLLSAKYARNHGKLISYDPNYRAALWSDGDEAAAMMRRPLPMVDILKISDEETVLLSGYEDPTEAAICLEAMGIQLVLVTLGANGVLYRYQGRTGIVPGYHVQVSDTNGAGDTFLGAVLAKLAKRRRALSDLPENELRQILSYANAAAALTTSRPGAIPAMPGKREVLAFMERPAR